MEQQHDSRAVSDRPFAASAASAEAPDPSPAGGPRLVETPPLADCATPAAAPPPSLADPTEQGAPPAGGYDPADYRWVPVRRRPRYDGWTEEKQRRFIEVLADTGLVSAAAKAVGMTRETAYRLRRSAHGAAFARAWDMARHHAGGLVEDIAFERAFEGVEHNVYDENGEVVCTKRVYNDRLLMFLLSHLKPERYAAAARAAGADAGAAEAPPPVALEASLKAMEPAPPEAPEQLLGPETLADELQIAEILDGKLPHFLSEQRPPKSEARIAAEARAAEEARGAEAWEKQQQGGALSSPEFADMCRYLDPIGARERGRRRYR
ncbi:MAG TPA: hypothetical protein VGC56_05000 [Allosphingosinicella sp.]|jgi:hypothetical protein